MGSYVQQVLIGGEVVKAEAKISIWSMWYTLVISGFLFLFGLVAFFAEPIVGLMMFMMASVPLLLAYIRYKTTELAITNKRVIAKFGFISRATVEINLAKVETLQIRQGLFGRILNYGSLIVSGGGNPIAPIPGIANPMEFKRIATETLNEFGASR